MLLTLVLFLQLCDRGVLCHKLHGKESTLSRHQTVQEFEQGRLGTEYGRAESKVLITTDMYSRGCDVPARAPHTVDTCMTYACWQPQSCT